MQDWVKAQSPPWPFSESHLGLSAPLYLYSPPLPHHHSVSFYQIYPTVWTCLMAQELFTANHAHQYIVNRSARNVLIWAQGFCWSRHGLLLCLWVNWGSADQVGLIWHGSTLYVSYPPPKTRGLAWACTSHGNSRGKKDICHVLLKPRLRIGTLYFYHVLSSQASPRI